MLMAFLTRSRAVTCAAALILGAGASFGMAADPTDVGLIEIKSTPTERPSPLADLFGEGKGETLRQLVTLLDEAAADDALHAVVVRIREADLSTTQVEELGAAMDRVRAAGKKVHIFSDTYSTAELLLGAHADEIIMQSGGEVSLPGLYMEEMYLADTLNWVGIQPDFVQIGDYKGASEPMARSGPSPEWDQNISQLLDGLYSNLRTQLMTGRRLSDAQLDTAMQKAVMANGDTGKEVGLVDATLDLPDLESHLSRSYSAAVTWTNLTEPDGTGASAFDAPNPFMLFSRLMRPASHKPKRDTIAVLHIEGPIVDGESEDGGLFGGVSVGSVTIRRAIQEIHDQDRVKGVIVRINSPGGSAIASEVIWQGLERLSKDKPVWVSVGSMAASGGYYIAVAGDRIYVNPSSIVGSIGVVGGKLAMGGLYDKVKLHVVPRSRGPMGGVLGSAKPWTDAERGYIRGRMTETYDLFTRRVTAGREGIDLDTTAEGRLFTGNVAVTNKMADKVGGLSDAIADLAKEAGLAEGEYDVLDYPPAPGLAEMLEGMLGTMASAPAADDNTVRAPLAAGIGVLREVVGRDAWPQVRDNLSALMQLRRERVLLVTPSVLIRR